MEEKHAGQKPEADRPAGGLQGDSARPGGHVKGGLKPTGQDKALVEGADRASADASAEMGERGFGDHKGTDGFPSPTGDA